jgi:phosphatidylglycerophosphate synthase
VIAPGVDGAQPAARAREGDASLPGLARAQQRTSLVTALLLPTSALVSLYFATLAPLALLGPVALALLVRGMQSFGSRHNTLPNAVTALRVMLTGLLALCSQQPWCTPHVAALTVLLIFALDGLDGVLARSLHASSAQGAHFDMESDAYLVLTVCSLHALAGHGAWVLTGGLLRYAYSLATTLFPSRGEAPRTRLGRYAFAASLGCLTVALVVPAALCVGLAALGTAILLWSFGRSFWWAFAAQTKP